MDDTDAIAAMQTANRRLNERRLARTPRGHQIHGERFSTRKRSAILDGGSPIGLDVTLDIFRLLSLCCRWTESCHGGAETR